MVTDYWTCHTCKVDNVISVAGELPAIEHTVTTGHATTLYHKSERSFFPVAVAHYDCEHAADNAKFW